MTTGVGVVGAGGWGTALAVMLARRGVHVTLWARRAEQVEALTAERENKAYLPGVALPSELEITGDLGRVARHRRIILAVPSQAVTAMWRKLAPFTTIEYSVINAAKGLESGTGKRLSQAVAAIPSPIASDRFAVLSGPNHAEEVGRGLPTTSVVASKRVDVAEEWQEILMGPEFRVYTSEDVVGVELGGALKNVIALAAGISDGLGFGDNTKAALITRGLAEMARLGAAMGANVLTFSGLSGMGDLIATCTSDHSRNARAGRRIGQGERPEKIMGETSMAIEGIPTCRAALVLAARHKVEMPITAAVGDVLFHGKSPSAAVAELMSRGPKDELHAFLGR